MFLVRKTMMLLTPCVMTTTYANHRSRFRKQSARFLLVYSLILIRNYNTMKVDHAVVEK